MFSSFTKKLDSVTQKIDAKAADAQRDIKAAANDASDRFSKLRGGNSASAASRPAPEVIEVIPGREVRDRRSLDRHFPNAARALAEYSDQKAKKSSSRSDVFASPTIVRGERGTDGKPISDIRINATEDPVQWRRMHLRSVDADRHRRADDANSAAIKARVDRLSAEDAQWRRRVEAHRAAGKSRIEGERADLKSRVSGADARRKTMIDERVNTLAYRDKQRAEKAKRAPRGSPKCSPK